MPVLRAAVTFDALDPVAHEALVTSSAAGAVVAFHGVIRDHDPEAHSEVVSVDYSHHPDAETILLRLVERVLASGDPDGEVRVAVSHRVGHLVVGEFALVCCAAAPHRAQAFGVCADLVEAIKAGVPIWKHQVESSGRAVWSGLGLQDET